MPALRDRFGNYRELAPAALINLPHAKVGLDGRKQTGEEVFPLGRRAWSWSSGMATLSTLMGTAEAGCTWLRNPREQRRAGAQEEGWESAEQRRAQRKVTPGKGSEGVSARRQDSILHQSLATSSEGLSRSCSCTDGAAAVCHTWCQRRETQQRATPALLKLPLRMGWTNNHKV